MQFAKVRDTLGISEKDFIELITRHPEKLLELTVRNSAESDVDADEQTLFFGKKNNPYAD